MLRQAVFLPPFGELADPRALADLAGAAEEAGWDGYFLWDHVRRPPADPAEVADPWIALAAAAMVTTTLRLGPMITPLARRRPQKVARETVTLDQLSSGRLTMGIGLGVDTDGELRRFGEETDPVRRAALLDEAVAVLLALWSGEPVDHRGPAYTVEDVRFLPRPVQRPRIPLWAAAREGAPAPLRRAARLDGVFPLEPDPPALGRLLEVVAAERGGLEHFDVAVIDRGDTDLAAMEAHGATWAMRWVDPGVPLREVAALVAAGPR